MLKVLVPNNITAAMLVSTSASAEPSAYEPDGTLTSGWSASEPYALLQYVYYEHRVYQAIVGHQSIATAAVATVTMTIAAPCVVTYTGHGLYRGAAIVFTTTGALPTGLSAGVTYYVGATIHTNDFTVSATIWGADITTTGTQSGTHKVNVKSTRPDLSLTGSNPFWIDIGPTNKFAIFDTYINTATHHTGTLEVVTVPGRCNGVAVLDVSGASSIQVAMVNGLDTVFDETQALDNSFISDWYEYFFEPFDVRTDVLFGPLPPYPSAEITITIVPDGGGVVSVGAAMYGNTVELGQVQAGATAGIVDFSRKETSEYGVTTLIERGFAKRASYSLVIDNAQLRRVYSTLAALRATPAVWVASDDYKLTPLTVFGWPKDFSINVAYATYSTATLEVEGMS